MASRLGLMPEVLRFDAYMDEALYGAGGFYERGGHPGTRDGDFATSVELGSLFARCVANYLDRTWIEMGRPDPFVVIEGGAGRGTLCRDVLAAVEGCREAVRYVMVERTESQRQAALGIAGEAAVLADLPAGPFVGVVLANELLDNLPIRLLERAPTGWDEVHVEVDEQRVTQVRHPAPDDASVLHPRGTRPARVTQVRHPAPDDASVLHPRGTRPARVTQVLRPVPDDASAMATALVPDAPVGSRIPLQLRASVWVRRALRLLEAGRVLIFDYGVRTTAELAQRPQAQWLRTYRSQRRADDPLAAPGTADITCEVAFDQLPSGARMSPQADWLAAHGIESMTAAAGALWERTRINPTAETLAARALLDEASALVDPRSFGAFWAAEWRID